MPSKRKEIRKITQLQPIGRQHSPDTTSNSENGSNSIRRSRRSRKSSISMSTPSSRNRSPTLSSSQSLASNWSISPVSRKTSTTRTPNGNKAVAKNEPIKPADIPQARSAGRKSVSPAVPLTRRKNSRKPDDTEVDSETEKVVRKPVLKIIPRSVSPVEKSSAEANREMTTAQDRSQIDSFSLADNTVAREQCLQKYREYASQSQKISTSDLRAEYDQLPGWPQDYECASFYHPTNRSKNRYTDIRCLDSSRVRLSFLCTCEGSDYIHANYISSRHLEHRWILTQGPKHSTIADFWRMVWQEGTTAIVMLCNFVELKKVKCAEYFPRTPNGIFRFEQLPKDFLVQYESSTKEQTMLVTTLRLEWKGESRRITHYQCLEWPDFEVPASSHALLRILSKLRTLKTPPIIHCAAGIGRSGTLISIEITLQALNNSTSTADIKQIVTHLRLYGRAGAVQTFEQYMLIRKVVLDYGVSIKAIKPEQYSRYTQAYIRQLALRQQSF